MKISITVIHHCISVNLHSKGKRFTRKDLFFVLPSDSFCLKATLPQVSLPTDRFLSYCRFEAQHSELHFRLRSYETSGHWPHPSGYPHVRLWPDETAFTNWDWNHCTQQDQRPNTERHREGHSGHTGQIKTLSIPLSLHFAHSHVYFSHIPHWWLLTLFLVQKYNNWLYVPWIVSLARFG